MNDLYIGIEGQEVSPLIKEKFLSSLDDNQTKNFDFVGFVISESSILFVLPKNYIDIKSIDTIDEKDIELIFKSLIKNNNNIRNYIGKEEGFESSFPFFHFFKIYHYYIRFGLHQNINDTVKIGVGGKIAWKDTMQKSTKFLDSNGDIVLYPIYSKVSKSESTFLSECMVYIINNTIDRFSYILDLPRPHIKIKNYKLFSHSSAVLAKLRKIQAHTFKDKDKQLVHSMIRFFEQDNLGGDLILKHYNFENVWEKAVNEYLNKYFEGIEINQDTNGLTIGFSEEKLNLPSRFKKEFFYVNKVEKDNRIEPDHYYIDDEIQLIFDSKYYTKINNIDYKQISYYQFLKSKMPNKTYNVLFIPTEEETRTNMIFDLKNEFFTDPSDSIKIYLCYLNIKLTLKNFIDE